MGSDDSSSTHNEPLVKNPTFWLVAPTLSLLVGQGTAASQLVLRPSWLLVLAIPLIFVFRTGTRAWGFFLLISGSAFSLGYARHHAILHPMFPPDHLRSVAPEGSHVYLEGVLAQEPERTPRRSRWLVRSQRIWHPTGAQEVRGDLLVTVRHERREWRYGDRVRFWARPLIPQSYGNPGGFDYASFLARREIYATAFLENDEGVELLQRGPPGIRHAIEHLRRGIARFIESNFSPESAALMKALVVGDRGAMPGEARERFVRAGVAHLLAISGLHVGMLGLVVFFLVRFVASRSAVLLLRFNLLKIAAFSSLLGVLFYTAIAGGQVPTVRAAIMMAVYVLAVLLDREDEVIRSLFLAALLIALYWPGAAMEVSFQLSFLAVLFIVWGLRKIAEWLPPPPRDLLPQERSWIRERLRPLALYLAVPILATIGTGPMIAHHFGHLSLAGFLANPVVVPIVGFLVVPLGLVIGIFSMLAPGLALPFVWLAEPLVALVLRMVRFFSGLPLASVAVPIPNLLEAAMLYLFILSLLLARRRIHALALLAGILLWAGAEGWYWGQERWNRRHLRITHLSVGHGDAAVVEFPGSKVLLVDSGGAASGEFDTGESIVAPFLRSRKILKVDYLLVTHPRVDHYGGMKTIAAEFRPSEFWSGPGRGKTARYLDLEETLDRLGIQRVLLSSRTPCRAIEGAEICVLYPPPGKTGDPSVVARLSFGQAKFLFAGDIERRDERVLLERKDDLSSTVLKVPRHGSAASSTEEFVSAVKPKLAIFSVAHRNRFGLPRPEVLERYARAGTEILRTDRDGAIVLETDGEEIRYRTYRSGKRAVLELGSR